MNGSVMNWSVMKMVCYEGGLFELGSYERVCYEHGLL